MAQACQSKRERAHCVGLVVGALVFGARGRCRRHDRVRGNEPVDVRLRQQRGLLGGKPRDTLATAHGSTAEGDVVGVRDRYVGGDGQLVDRASDP